MNEYFKKFRQTGKVADYLKYKEELAKDMKLKEVKNENNQNKGTSPKKY